MRDILRIARIISKITLIWNKLPDYRFFQLIDFIKNQSTFCIKSDPFYFEDNDFEDLLDEILIDFK